MAKSKQQPRPIKTDSGTVGSRQAVWGPRLWFVVGPGCVAILAYLAVYLTLSPATGPGVTCDEAYDFYVGFKLLHTLFLQGPEFFLPENIATNYDLTVHPPLGRYLAGAAQILADPWAREGRIHLEHGRIAAAVVYSLMVFLTGLYTATICGRFGGTAAALGLALVPRVFGHAHLATLDTVTAATCAAALYALVIAQRRDRWWSYALAGCVWGLALLSKIHGVVLVVPAIVWMLIVLRQRTLVALPIWLLSGTAVFFAGWPWLWIDPIGHVAEFLGTATDRASLNVFYWGQAFADVDAPWHYPFVMFLVTVPLGTLLLGAFGLARSGKQLWTDPARLICWLGGGFLLVLFAWPGTPVYDGVRLFLPVYPLWAVFVGIGAAQLAALPLWSRMREQTVQLLLVAFLLLQGVGIWLYQPYYLSHYNALVGGLPGAERLGFEITYWGDTVNGQTLDELLQLNEVAQSGEPLYASRLIYAPQVAPFQAEAVFNFTPLTLSRGASHLQGWDPHDAHLFGPGTFAVIYRRRADEAVWEEMLGEGRPYFQAVPVCEVQRQGVWLARIYHWQDVPMK